MGPAKNGSELGNQGLCLQGLPIIPLHSIALHSPYTVFQFFYGSDYHSTTTTMTTTASAQFHISSIFSESFQTGLFKHGRQVTALPETPVQSPRKETQESAKIVNLWTSIFNSKGWQDRLSNGILSVFHKLKGVKNWRLVTCHRTRWFSDSLHP